MEIYLVELMNHLNSNFFFKVENPLDHKLQLFCILKSDLVLSSHRARVTPHF